MTTITSPVWLSFLFVASLAAQTLDFPEGIRNPDDQTAYIRNGTVLQALSMSEGKLHWTDQLDGRPIAVFADQLVVQIEAGQQHFRIALIDCKTGQLKAESQDVPFSTTIRPSSFLRPTVSVTLADRKLLLSWQVYAHYSGGANPSANQVKSLPSISIEAEMDLETGRISPGKEKAESLQPSCSMNHPPGLIDIQAVEYVRQGHACSDEWSIKEGFFAQLFNFNKDWVSLQIRANAPTRKTRIQLAGARPDSPPYVTVDGQFIILKSYSDRWTVYSATSGTKIGSFYSTTIDEPVVAGGRVFFKSDTPTHETDSSATSSQLIASNLSTGSIIWTFPLSGSAIGKRPKLPQ
jgi:hypothetical protein